MSCIAPPELADRELLAYLDGEEDQRVMSHLERCAHCRERAQRLARLQGRLTVRLGRHGCPTPFELGEHHLGLLPHDRAAAIAKHLAECPRCSAEVAQLKDYLQELAPEVDYSPLERVRVLVARLVREAQGWVGPGALAPAPAYAGIRGKEEEGLHLYRADDVQVAIQVQDDAAQPGRKVAFGLVTGAESRGLRAYLWRAHEQVAEVGVDEVGNFILSNLPPGRYELILSGPDLEIHIQGLGVGTG